VSQYESFILEFQEKAKTLINIAKKLKFSVSSEPTKTKKSGYQFGNLYLTEREFECINYLTRGKTAEEIAIILNISKRTVETHVNNIKRKMNCYNQFRLGYLLGRIGINPSLNNKKALRLTWSA
jgi:DNA-binding CsgD family transcriptional regulator